MRLIVLGRDALLSSDSEDIRDVGKESINTEGDPIKVSRSGSGICQSLSLTSSVYVGSCSNFLGLNYCLLCFLERVGEEGRGRGNEKDIQTGL